MLTTHVSIIRYQKTKSLLKEQFGNECRISCTYTERTLNWPTIKSQLVLQGFALFLRCCCNAMEEAKYLELNTVSKMRNVVHKLPYKFTMKWCAKAFKLQEQQTRRVAMINLVCFIEIQASIISDPVFGDIQDINTKCKSKAVIKLEEKLTACFVQEVRKNLCLLMSSQD